MTNVTHITESVYESVENIVGKGKKCWLLAFFLFSNNVFKSCLPHESFKLGVVW